MSLRDAKGWTWKPRYYITGDNGDDTYETDIITVAQALEAALIGLSNCAVQVRSALSGADQTVALAYGTNAEYRAAWMQARFMFETANAERSVFGVGAPKLAIFETDGVTVKNDGTQAAVVAYVNAVKNASNTVFVSAAGGDPYVTFVGGILKIGRQPRRFSETIKSAVLVQGEGE